MKVKIGNTVYDGEKEMIMVILTDKDKKNIASMHPEADKYCEYPDNTPLSDEDILNWMEQV